MADLESFVYFLPRTDIYIRTRAEGPTKQTGRALLGAAVVTVSLIFCQYLQTTGKCDFSILHDS